MPLHGRYRWNAGSTAVVSVKSAAALSLTSVRPGFTSDFTWSVFGFIIDPDFCSQIFTLFYLVMTVKLDQDRNYDKIKCLH